MTFLGMSPAVMRLVAVIGAVVGFLGVATWWADSWFDRGEAANAAANAEATIEAARDIAAESERIENETTYDDAVAAAAKRLLWAPEIPCPVGEPDSGACDDLGSRPSGDREGRRDHSEAVRAGDSRRLGPSHDALSPHVVAPVGGAPEAQSGEEPADAELGREPLGKFNQPGISDGWAALLIMVVAFASGVGFKIVIDGLEWPRLIPAFEPENHSEEDMTLNEFNRRPLIPVNLSKILVAAMLGGSGFLGVWVFDANAKIAEQTQRIESLERTMARMDERLEIIADRLTQSVAIQQRMLGQMEMAVR